MTRPTTLETYRTWLTQLSDAELATERSAQNAKMTSAMNAFSDARRDAENTQRWLREVQVEVLNRMSEEDPPF